MKRFSPLIAVVLAGSIPADNACGILPLRDQWQSACQALQGGHAARAVALFREFEDWYGGEEQARDPVFRESLLRIWGMAAIEAGESNEAAGLLEDWFSENPEQVEFRAFLRFQLIMLYRILENREAVDLHSSLFLEEHPELPEGALIRWTIAEAAMSRQEYDQAKKQLDIIVKMESLPASGKVLAAAALALIRIGEGTGELALKHLLAEAKGDAARVLKFWRALLAPTLVDQLLQDDQPESATVAAEWFEQAENLKKELIHFRSRIELRMGSHSSFSARQTIWNSHWQGQLDRLTHSLEQGSAQSPDINSLYALRLRCLLEDGEHLSVAVLAQALLESTGQFSSALRAEAYKAAIESCLELKEWQQGRAFINKFQQAHPDDPALPEILFLNARTAAATSMWKEAVSLVENLLRTYPGHDSVRSWKMLRADWLLRAGKSEEAFEAFRALSKEAPSGWLPFLDFQKARCFIAMKSLDEAVAMLQRVSGENKASATLREFALIEILKIHLRRFDISGFEQILEYYHKTFSEGVNQWAVGNLAGTFARQKGDLKEAIRIFNEVAAAGHPASEYAHEELSALYRQTKDYSKLRAHALTWIQDALSQNTGMSDTPFLDCTTFQELSGEPAIPGALAESLIERIDSVPIACLETLHHLWDKYYPILGAPSAALDWVDAMAGTAYRESDWPSYATWQSFAAQLMELAGRQDSADARRILILHSVEPGDLPESTAFLVARTAHLYDFPEGENLLQSFLKRFPDSGQRPDALFMLSEILRSQQKDREAYAFLREIITDWRDAPVYGQASMKMAAWMADDGNDKEAQALLTEMLETENLDALQQATALLLRAQVDFRTGSEKRGFLGCLRILTLYPDLHDISHPANTLLVKHSEGLPDGDLKRTILERINKLKETHAKASQAS